MINEGRWHQLVKLALDECLRDFVETDGINARVTTEEPFGYHSQRQVDNFAEFFDTCPSAVAIEVESGVKNYPTIEEDITNRFEYYRSKGLISILAADKYTLNGKIKPSKRTNNGDESKTIGETAQEHGNGIIEVEVTDGSVQFTPIDGMDEGALSEFAAFMNGFTFVRND